ncbi:MAG: hypothetical protein JW939_00120 [Candidatus Thermoplasmatota archaeon]|nr:hypothetical protein [Candidatus Thermoplasmatota archaeon]
MRSGICAAVDEDVALGLNLAGVTEVQIWEKGMDVDILKKWFLRMMKEVHGVMILSQDCGEALGHQLFEKRVQGLMLPVTVMIPGAGEDRRTRELIKRAVGMDPGRDGERDLITDGDIGGMSNER